MWIIVFFILGTLFGSFGSVLLYRLDADCSRKSIRSILIGRSHDVETGHTLKRYQLIPIVSRFIQGGKSTYTNKKLPTLYLALELGSGVIFALTYVILQSNNLVDINMRQGRDVLVFWLTTNWLLTLLALRDIKTLTLHMPLRWITCVRVIGALMVGQRFPLYYSLVTTAIMLCLFILIYYGAKQYAQKKYNQDEGFGEGDIRLAGIIGILLPFTLVYHNIGLSLFTLIYLIVCYITLSSIIAIALYVIQSITQTQKNKSDMPVIAFFPAMILGLRTVLLTFQHIYT